jgi:pantetheine-phosphate adenylyltransferase
MKVLYPGSFDPITLGHINIINRAVHIFDKIVICVTNSLNKGYLFSLEERYALVKESLKEVGQEKPDVIMANKLTIDVAKKTGAETILRGLRDITDLNYEIKFSQINRRLSNNNIDVLNMIADEGFNVSSSQIKELSLYNANIDDMVTKCVLEELRKRFNSAQ